MAGGSGRATKFAVALEAEGITVARLVVGVAAKAVAYAALAVTFFFVLASEWQAVAVSGAVFVVGAAGWALMARRIAKNGTLTWRQAMQGIRSVPTWSLLSYLDF